MVFFDYYLSKKLKIDIIFYLDMFY